MPLRTAIEFLFSRVEKLTDLAKIHGIPVPALNDDEQAMLDQICANLELSGERITPGIEAVDNSISQPFPPASNDPLIPIVAPSDDFLMYNTMPAECQHDPTMMYDFQTWADLSTLEPWDGSPSDWPWQILNNPTVDVASYNPLEQPQFGPQHTLATNQGMMDASGDNVASNGSSDDEGETSIVPRLAARFGSLRVSHDGSLRYYGTASNYHFLGNPVHSDLNIKAHDIEKDSALALENAHLDREVPSDLQEDLIDLYFKWHNSVHCTVDRDIFDATRAHGSEDRSAFVSQSLIAVMCALGAAFGERYHASFITFPKPLANFFADKSKVLLEVELDSPSVSTVQTLLLLSSYEATHGHDARLWLYGGMAMRLAFALGLHVDSTTFVEQGLLTAKEADARRKAFWSCLVVNYLWSFSFGRPFRVDSEEVTVKPVLSTPVAHSNIQSASPMDLPTSMASSIPPTDGSLETAEEISLLVMQQWVVLCEQLAPLIRVLYGCVKISKAALQNLSQQTTTHLLGWQGTLPRAIQVHPDKVAGPDVLLLHMGFNYFCILVHRPWTSKSSQPRGRIGPGYKHARQVCRTSASEIASLLRKYELHHGFRRMNVYAVTIIFSASLILIFGLVANDRQGEVSHEEEQSAILGDLNTCFRALEELSQSYDYAKHIREHLLAIQRHWAQCQRDALNGTKRKSQPHLHQLDTFAKRSRGR